MEYVSPIDERVQEPVPFAARPGRRSPAARVALLDITKARGAEFLDRIESAPARGGRGHVPDREGDLLAAGVGET